MKSHSLTFSKYCALALALFLIAGIASAQGSRKDDIALVHSSTGADMPVLPIPYATVTVCTSSGTGAPCTPVASTTNCCFSDAALTQQIGNPFHADANGNYGFYATPGRYLVSITANGYTSYTITYVMPCDPSYTYTGGVCFSSGGGGGMVYPSGNGIPQVTGGSAWGTTIVPGTGVVTALGQAVSGSGGFCLTTNCALITPNLGTPSAINLANATNLSLSQVGPGAAGAGTFNFSGVTLLELRVGAGLTTSTNGDFGYDSTNQNWHGWNGADAIFAPLATGFVSGHCGQPTSTSGKWVIADTGSACGSGSGGVTGPGSSTLNDVAAFNNTSGSLLLDTGILYTNLPTQASNGTANQIATYSATGKAIVPATTLPTAAEPAHTGDATNSGGSLAMTVVGLRGISLPTLAASTGFLYDSSGVLSLSASLANITSGYPTICTAGQFSQGVSSGSNNCATPTGSGTVNSGTQYALGEYATAGTAISSGPTPPSSNGVYSVVYNVNAGAAVAPVISQEVASGRSITGATSSDTVASTDFGTIVTHDQAGSSAVAITLPTATSLNNPAFWYKYCNHSAQTDTLTPTTWTIQTGSATAGASQSIASGVCLTVTPDKNSSTQWHGDLSNVAGASGLADPGSNGIVKRTALNTTGIATRTDIDALSYVAGGGTAQAQTATLSPAISAYTAGLVVRWKPTAANTATAPTLAVNGLAAITIVKEPGNAALVANDLTTTAIASAFYDGTNFELQNPQTSASGAGTGSCSGVNFVTAVNSGSAPTCGPVTASDLPTGIFACSEVWSGSGTSSALQSGDDAISNNSCYNDSGSTRTITAVKCRVDAASNTTTVNPTFGSAGTGTTILSAALTCGSSYAFSSSGTVSNASWTTGAGIDPGMGGTLTGTSVALLVEYHY